MVSVKLKVLIIIEYIKFSKLITTIFYKIKIMI